MRKSNILKKLLVVENILIVICLILVIVLKTKLTYSLYWTITPLLIILIALYIREIDKGLMDLDKNKSSQIKRSYNDISTVATVFYGCIYLLIEFVDMLNETFRNNLYIMIGYLIITIVYEVLIYTSIGSAIKETEKLLKK